MAGELARPRLGYASQRWATVFPLGMYCPSAFSVSAVANTPGLDSFARGWLWVAVAAWAAAGAALTRRGCATLAQCVEAHTAPRGRGHP